MALVANSIDSMFNGVSQQPANLRLPSQCAEQINGYASVASGLSKRAPAQHLAKLQSAAVGDAFVHIINRSTTERYAVIITDESMKVYDLITGAAETIVYEQVDPWVASTPTGKTAMVYPTVRNKYQYRLKPGTATGTTSGTEPTWPTTLGETVVDGGVTWICIPNYFAIPAGALASESFEVVTVADYSFVVNKTITVTEQAVSNATPNNLANWYFPTNWQASGSDERYYLPTEGSDEGKLQTMTDLPTASSSTPPTDGDYYEITGDSLSGFSSFYVMYQGGVWIETHETNTATRPDEATMPHALVRESDGDFHIREFGWVPRLFGNFESNVNPSFVGQTITDIGYYKNRLCVSAGENIIFSGAGDYGNFYRSTVTQLLDSDVVDVAVSSQSVSTINYILPAENGMMFFSDQTQFVLNVDQLLTPSTVSIDVATSYEMAPNVKPISVGQDIFFSTESGDFSRIREYTLGGAGSITTDATDISAHAERYIPKNLTRLSGSSNEDIIFCLSKDSSHRNKLYVYKFFYSGGEKVQSAWGTWEFAAQDLILDVSVLNNKAYLVVERDDGVFLETINIRTTDFPLALTYDILLDRRYNFASGNKSFDGTYTTFTLPYELLNASEEALFRLVEADGATDGRVLLTTDYTFPTATTVRVTGDFTAIEIYGGLNYTFTYTFSEQFHRGRNGAAITTGKYQLRTITMVYEDMAYFSTVVDPYGTGDVSVTEPIVTEGLSDFTGKTLGEASLIVGTPVFGTGTYEFQIYGNSKVATIDITNDVPFGGSFVSATVEGFYTNRGR